MERMDRDSVPRMTSGTLGMTPPQEGTDDRTRQRLKINPAVFFMGAQFFDMKIDISVYDS